MQVKLLQLLEFNRKVGIDMKFPKKLDIPFLSNGYKLKRFTPKDVCEEILKRVQENRDMNIWITEPNMEHMMKYVTALEEKDIDDLPLWGIPFAVKDNIDVEDFVTTAACPKYAYNATENAVTVQRLIDSGAIPIGKTNLDQFATGLVGTRSPYGEVHNSLNPKLISGGSSSGSAVAVAMGQCAFSLGTDTAGSGRVPAALNNLVGYKSSVGAWPTKGLVPACASLDVITVFAHSSEEVFAVDNVARGYCLDDIWSKEYPQIVSESPKKIFLSKDSLEFYGDYKEQYKKAFDNAVERLKKLDIEIEYIDYEIFRESAKILYESTYVAERWADLHEFVEANPDEVFPVTREILAGASNEKFDAKAVFKDLHKLQEYRAKARQILHDGILVMPTCGGTWSIEQVNANPIKTNSDMGKYTNHCNLLDLAAIAIPMGFADENIPFGITAFSLSNQESMLKGFSEGLKKIQTVEIAVCGLHMRGFALEYQLVELGAKYSRTDKTSNEYKMFKHSSGKPCLVKSLDGCNIEVEVWDISLDKLGEFLRNIPEPLGLGEICLEDNTKVIGFISQGSELPYGEDISRLGGWRYIVD